MSNILPLLQLLRWRNLLVIIFTQLLLRYCLIHPIFTHPLVNYEPSLNHFQFLLLILSTICIAGAGYLINDCFDVETDLVNKPHKVIIDKQIDKNSAMRYYYGINAVGIVLGFYLAWVIGDYRLGFIHLVTAILLWLYSKKWKQQLLLGNLLVSWLVAMVVLLVTLYDARLSGLISHKVQAFIRTAIETLTGYQLVAEGLPDIANYELLNFMSNYLLGYALFAFLLTFIREIVKDIEDIQGDRAVNYHTLPIVVGQQVSKLIALAITLFTMKLLFDFQLQQWQLSQYISVIFVGIGLQLPLCYFVFQLWKARFKPDFHHLSQLLKVVMLAGIAYLLYFRFTIEMPETAPNTSAPAYDILDIDVQEDSSEDTLSEPTLFDVLDTFYRAQSGDSLPPEIILDVTMPEDTSNLPKK